MGWCSATEIFDSVVGALLDPTKDKEQALKDLINALEDGDWDCQEDSEYWDNPLVQKVFRELHSDWFDDDEPAPSELDFPIDSWHDYT